MLTWQLADASFGFAILDASEPTLTPATLRPSVPALPGPSRPDDDRAALGPAPGSRVDHPARGSGEGGERCTAGTAPLAVLACRYNHTAAGRTYQRPHPPACASRQGGLDGEEGAATWSESSQVETRSDGSLVHPWPPLLPRGPGLGESASLWQH